MQGDVRLFRVLAIVLLQALVGSKYVYACENSKFGGFYAGATVGFGKGTFDDIDLNDPNDPAVPADIPLYNVDTNGAVAGGYAGHNYQCGATVFGIEGDFLWSGMNGDQTQAVSGVDLTADTATKYLASIRGRLGIDVGSALF